MDTEKTLNLSKPSRRHETPDIQGLTLGRPSKKGAVEKRNMVAHEETEPTGPEVRETLARKVSAPLGATDSAQTRGSRVGEGAG